MLWRWEQNNTSMKLVSDGCPHIGILGIDPIEGEMGSHVINLPDLSLIRAGDAVQACTAIEGGFCPCPITLYSCTLDK